MSKGLGQKKKTLTSIHFLFFLIDFCLPSSSCFVYSTFESDGNTTVNAAILRPTVCVSDIIMYGKSDVIMYGKSDVRMYGKSDVIMYGKSAKQEKKDILLAFDSSNEFVFEEVLAGTEILGVGGDGE